MGKFLNKNAVTFQSKAAKGCQSRSASKFPGKSVSRFLNNPAKMFPRRSVAKFPANHALKFQNKSARKYPSRSAKTFQDKSAEMSPSKAATKFPKSPVKHFISAPCARSPHMDDSSLIPKLNISTIREPIWNKLHFSPTQPCKPYEVLFIVLFIPCLWNNLQTP